MRQIAQPRGNLIEKIVRDSSGRLIRATFCVYECEGHIKARLVSVIYLEEKPTIENKITFLTSPRGTLGEYGEIIFCGKIVSPFIYSNILSYLGSKPRAPTF